MLTPEEFVKAGDQLVRTCPNWQWQSGEHSKKRPYLPESKQYLFTRGVPSYRRVSAMQAATYTDTSIVGDASGEDWCAPQLLPLGEEVEDFDTVLIEASDLSIEDDKSTDKVYISKDTSNAPSEKQEQYLDLEEASLALDESANTAVEGAAVAANSKSTSAIVRSRRYDVSITYDNYYRTPRIWLYGFSENGSPLSATEVYQVM